MQYRREIDGLRAVAVVPVVLFHAGFDAFSGGFVGVDVFFVISGYLITSILIADLQAGNFSILRFYERRARRILPALFTVLAVCVPFAVALMLPARLRDFSESVIAVIFFGSNVLFWQEYSYFDLAGKEKPLLHTWSLAVEEQFYLLFPLLLLVLWQFGRQRTFWILVAIAGLSLLLSEWGWRFAPTANFFLAPPRAWELLAGSLCAFFLAGRAQYQSNPLSLLGLAMIVASIFWYHERTPFPSLYALLPVGGTVLIVLFAATGTVVARLLSSGVFVGIGLISYSAYLWHQPIFAFARISGIPDGETWLMGLLIALSFALAWATWLFIEQPFRRRNRPLLGTRRQVFAAAGVASSVFLAIGIAGVWTNGLEYRLTPQERLLLQYADYPVEGFYRRGKCMLTAEQTYRDFDPACWQSASEFLIGDSHAGAFGAGIPPDRTIANLTQTSCPPVVDYRVFNQPTCAGINAFRFAQIAAAKAEVVYLHAAWSEYWYRRGFQAKFDMTLSQLSQSGVEVIIIGNVPQFSPNLPEMIVKTQTALVPGSTVTVSLDDLRQVNDALRSAAERHGATFWDPLATLCREDTCEAVLPLKDGDFRLLDVALFSFDNGHMTYSGAAHLVGRFFEEMDG